MTLLLASADSSHAMLLTIASAISAGVALITIARRLNLPAIVLLLVGGIALGPAVMGDYALINPKSLGDGLLVIVSLSVGLILFEGGLTLDLEGYRSASAMIKRLLSVGVAITWAGISLAVYFICDVPREQAIMAGSLVIVTGPTVIAPMLKRIRVNAKLHSILHWEGVLIDPIGVFIALLCFESITQGTDGAMANPFINLGIRLGWGLVVGIVGGLVLSFLIRRHFIPDDMINIFTLGFAVMLFGLADAVISEAGLLAVTAAGFTLGLRRSAQIKEVKAFKAEITDLLIGTLFMLLASRLSFDQFVTFGATGAIAVAVAMFVVRPLSIGVCSWRLDLTGRERAFLSWIAPRGIVAASMASLVAIRLDVGGAKNAVFVETFTYSVIIATIVIQGLSAGLVSRVLGVGQPEARGWLIVGAHTFGRRIARFLRAHDVPAVVVDTNRRAVQRARADGVVALLADARDTSISERPAMHSIGNVLALTDNEDLNIRLCEGWSEVFGTGHVYRSHQVAVEDAEAEGDDLSHGRVVFVSLPRPTLLAAEIDRRQTSMIEATGQSSVFAAAATPIVAIHDGRAVLDPDKPAEDAEGRATLYVERRVDSLLRSVRPELVGVLGGGGDLSGILEQLIDRVITIYPHLSRQTILGELIEREASLPSALGQAVAVPHAYVDGLDQRVCAIGVSSEDINMATPDHVPVRIIFLLLSPPGEPEGHLAALAEIANLVLNDDTRGALLAADSPAAIISIIDKAAD